MKYHEPNQPPVRIVLAQLNFLVGDIPGNTQKIINAITHARETLKAQAIVFPELALTGYPPEDLLFRDDFHSQVTQGLLAIAKHTQGLTVIVGHPYYIDHKIYNAAAIFQENTIAHHYYKQCLPNYGVFDEQRYFSPGKSPCVISIEGISIGIVICEDLWHEDPLAQAKKAGAKLIISLNASPFEIDKQAERQRILHLRTTETQLPILYVNHVGTQDDVIFDGGSMAIDPQGQITAQAPFFEEAFLTVNVPLVDTSLRSFVHPTKTELLYQALVMGVLDYVEKNRFPGVLLGLSGGIDSALTLAIAVDALGADKVEAVMMPSQHTSDLSLKLAENQVKELGVHYRVLPIESIYQSFMETLSHPKGLTAENLQSRCRGTLLMALSNQTGYLVLTTGNKSELAVGYCTLYGDTAGGFAVLKDVWKTQVFELARYRGLPLEIINRPPTAELSPNQKDEDSLPPYSILDQILRKYVERDESLADIVAAGFSQEQVEHVIKLVNRSEYKRRQYPPGVKVSSRAFMRERRYPITSGYDRIK